MMTIEKVACRTAFDALVESCGHDIAIEGQPWGGVPMKVCARLGHDDGNLYVSMRSYERHCRAVVTEHDGSVHLDSCLEFFFSPCPGIRPDYFNMEANPNGAMKFNYGSGRDGRIKTGRLPEYAGLSVKVTPEWWQLTYTIPYALIRDYAPEFAGRSGDVIRLNMYRCGPQAEIASYVQLFPADPAKFPKPDFHRPENFGEAVLE